MRTPFVESVLTTLLADAELRRSDSILAVCAGDAEHELFVRLGLTNTVISNVDERMSPDQFLPLDWSFQDATNLTLEDESFDFAFVADGLHHTSTPHRAMLEMYRVARQGIVVIESRDTVLTRFASRLGFSSEYEVEAVVDNDFRKGGLNNTEIPNYVYRWTESEFTKTIRSFDPIGRHRFRFFYDLNLPYEQTKMKQDDLKLRILELADPVLGLFTRIFKKQCNSFAMVALKPRIPEDLWPWLAVDAGRVHFNRGYAGRRMNKVRLSRAAPVSRDLAVFITSPITDPQ
jgi:SAM-dependent methyltransferase